MSKRVLCKFFAHGACLKGDHCEFSHDWKDPSNNVCTFYQKGACLYGSRCRYEHVKVSTPQSSAASSSTTSHQFLVSDSATASGGLTIVPGVTSDLSPSRIPFFPPAKPAWSQTSQHQYLIESDDVGDLKGLDPADLSLCSFGAAGDCPRGKACPHTHWDLCPSCGKHCLHPFRSQQREQHMITCGKKQKQLGDFNGLDPADLPICSFAAAGECPRGEACPHMHGDLCPSCGKHCLHPFRRQQREQHKKACWKKQKQLEELQHSQEIECSVCLERVLSKPTAAERKFGLLSECDHPFCISCIRNWRGSSPASGMDVNSTLRACPICRKVSYFVIPSVIWYSSKEEKQDIVDTYKEKLRSIDCKHFDFGNGSCPFGSSCFYKHAYRDGSLEEVVLRHLGAEDGHTVIAKNIRLSDFLRSLHIRLLAIKKLSQLKLPTIFNLPNAALQYLFRIRCCC
ncbi:hypothetical protein Vadar_027465 [Vaccinium darrowii]|uniref:Uncharacterized protein n=1 Tax=Vaccinium darrowii TaxID=229202 RepID=A0ACB7ZES1_9ERIC|nr:hypothetical protein Vadar_027465 [Vaccinium darrowii]